MVSYRKIIKKRIDVLIEEIETINDNITEKTQLMEAIAREPQVEPEKQADRADSLNGVTAELYQELAKKEMLEQKIAELELVRALVNDIKEERKEKE